MMANLIFWYDNGTKVSWSIVDTDSCGLDRRGSVSEQLLLKIAFLVILGPKIGTLGP